MPQRSRLHVVVILAAVQLLVMAAVVLGQDAHGLLAYRLGLNEDAVKEVSRQHLWLLALLIGNLATLIATLVIMLVRRPHHR